jgi:predicted metal-dependent peptidase
MDLKLKPEDKLRRGIIRLQRPQPFFAYLLMNLRPKHFPKELESAPGHMPTMGINPLGELFYSDEFVENLSMPEVFGCLCHEVLHIALLHPMRTGNRIHIIANFAQDVVVNMIVMQTAANMNNNRYSHYGRGAESWLTENFVEMKLPEGTVPVDVQGDTSDFVLPMEGGKVNIHIDNVSKKAWEEVYAEIIEQIRNQNQDPKSAQRPQSSGFDNHISGQGSGMTAKEIEQAANKWQGNIAEAANYAKAQGKLPGGMNRIIDELLKPKVVWKQLLMKFLRPHIQPVDWTYQKPNKKSQVLGVFLPSTVKEHCEVEVIVDTSGSVSQQELKEFVSEIVAIAQSMQHVQMGVTFVDSEIHTRYEVENGDIPKILAMEPKGGGGTDMEEGLDHIKKTNREVPVAIVLTDGYTSFNRRARDYPFEVIWVITENGISKERMKSEIPYGHAVKMQE